MRKSNRCCAAADCCRSEPDHPLDADQRTLRKQRDIALAGAIEKALDHGVRAVSDRKHPPVRLGLEDNSEAREPLDGVARLPAVKRCVQLARAARIVFRQLAGIETRVSHVATPAAGDPDFLQEVRAFLEDRHASPRSHFRVLQRGEKARRAAADHGKVEWRSR